MGILGITVKPLLDQEPINPTAVAGRKQEKTLQLLGLPAGETHCPTP
ncbi:hypothetical protein M3558_09505 [Brevibacillus invocatus]|nr:hypothetical protein [Brevibacillus invocatus]